MIGALPSERRYYIKKYSEYYNSGIVIMANIKENVHYQIEHNLLKQVH